MGLSASLFLRQSQSLVMTPQLMQSIQLLQMTHFELNHFIEQEVEKNPLLDLVANDDYPSGSARLAREEMAQQSEDPREAHVPLGIEADVYASATASTSDR